MPTALRCSATTSAVCVMYVELQVVASQVRFGQRPVAIPGGNDATDNRVSVKDFVNDVLTIDGVVDRLPHADVVPGLRVTLDGELVLFMRGVQTLEDNQVRVVR